MRAGCIENCSSQSSTLCVVETQALVTEHLAEDAIFLLEIVSPVELLAMDPFGEYDKQVLQRRKGVEHGGV